MLWAYGLMSINSVTAIVMCGHTLYSLAEYLFVPNIYDIVIKDNVVFYKNKRDLHYEREMPCNICDRF